MKFPINLPVSLRQCLTFIALFFFHTLAWAQDKKYELDVDVSSGKGPAPSVAWYASPWAWVIGGAVFIIILVAILSSNNRSKGN